MVLRDFEKEWVSCFNHSFLAFFRDHRCKSNDPQFSISMSEMAVKDYSADIRCVRNLFAPLPEDLSEFEELLIYFPPEYTVNALEEDVKALDVSVHDELRVYIHLSTLHPFPDFSVRFKNGNNN
jgi:hypothetical protein